MSCDRCTDLEAQLAAALQRVYELQDMAEMAVQRLAVAKCVRDCKTVGKALEVNLTKLK